MRVVDTRASGRRIVWGELYFVLQSNGPVLWQVNRCTHGVSEPCALLDPLNIYRGSFADLPADATRIVHFSDGPLQIHHLRQNLLGRVVGLFDPRERADRQQEAAQLKYLLNKKREREIDGRLA